MKHLLIAGLPLLPLVAGSAGEVLKLTLPLENNGFEMLKYD
ncbi:MAG: hypothetical protein R3F13_06985 [Prosthecobacter sp.]